MCPVCVCAIVQSARGGFKKELGNKRRLTWSAMVINESPLYGTSAVRFRSSELAADPASQRRNAGAHKGDTPGFIERDVILPAQARKHTFQRA